MIRLGRFRVGSGSLDVPVGRYEVTFWFRRTLPDHLDGRRWMLSSYHGGHGPAAKTLRMAWRLHRRCDRLSELSKMVEAEVDLHMSPQDKVRRMCNDANQNFGCDLKLVKEIDGEFLVDDGWFTALGSPEKLKPLIEAFGAGWSSAGLKAYRESAEYSTP